jgi:hypothetical protein
VADAEAVLPPEGAAFPRGFDLFTALPAAGGDGGGADGGGGGPRRARR